jgi:hypothetical protein
MTQAYCSVLRNAGADGIIEPSEISTITIRLAMEVQPEATRQNHCEHRAAPHSHRQYRIGNDAFGLPHRVPSRTSRPM